MEEKLVELRNALVDSQTAIDSEVVQRTLDDLVIAAGTWANEAENHALPSLVDAAAAWRDGKEDEALRKIEAALQQLSGAT